MTSICLAWHFNYLFKAIKVLVISKQNITSNKKCLPRIVLFKNEVLCFLFLVFSRKITSFELKATFISRWLKLYGDWTPDQIGRYLHPCLNKFCFIKPDLSLHQFHFRQCNVFSIRPTFLWIVTIYHIKLQERIEGICNYFEIKFRTFLSNGCF